MTGTIKPQSSATAYADVDRPAVDDVLPCYRRVHDRKCFQRLYDAGDDERHVGELLSGRGLEIGALPRANARNTSEIDLHERRDVSRSAPRGNHVVADQRAHFGHRLDAIARPWLGGG
jgi:hypothetical protein